MKKTDWSIFEGELPAACFCGCGAVFHSHAKYDMSIGGCVSQKECPKCGSDRTLQRVCHESEIMSLSEKDCERINNL